VLERAGARVAIAHVKPPAPMRTLMLTDFAWARAARLAARAALEGLTDPPPRAVIYSSTTAALLWPRPGVIRFDAPSAGNRQGRHGLWQRPLERRRLAEASLLLPWSDGGFREAPATVLASAAERTLVLPVYVEPSGAEPGVRDITAITYAANPAKKGLDRVLAAWREVYADLPADQPRELVVAGASAQALRESGLDLDSEPGVRVVS
jgi:hypothetical protein